MGTRRAIVGLVSAVVATVGLVPAEASAISGLGPGEAKAGTLKLPDGPASIRGLSDQATVEGFTGQVSYSVPLELPPGIGGFAPSLSLRYEGALGNGTIGIGWTIELPAIRRSLRHGVPSYTDADELELVGLGGGRLVSIGGQEYRVEGKGNAFRVVRRGARFEVTDDSGTRFVFGTTEASRTQEGAQIATWHLATIVNLAAQAIELTYEKHAGQVYPKEIAWGPLGQSRATFEYDPRSDAVVSWRTGFEVRTERLLRRVRVMIGAEEARAYHLEYDGAFPLARVRSVRMTGRAGQGELPTLSFSYEERGNPRIDEIDTHGWVLGQRGVIWLDVNGDGMPDLARLGLGDHAWRQNFGGRFSEVRAIPGAQALDLGTAQVLDLDGDSRPELVHVVDDTWRAYRIVEGAWESVGTWPGSRNVPLGGPGVVLTDLNGDGRTDVVRAGTSGLMVWMNTAAGLAPARLVGPISDDDLEVEPGSQNCAEDNLVDQLGGDPSKVRMTPAVRPRTGENVPVCERCEGRYGRDSFPDPETKYESDNEEGD